MRAAIGVWLVLGLLVGELHLRALWAQVHRAGALSWARGPLSIGFLLAAALLHGLAAAAVGWGLGALFGLASRARPGSAR